MPTPQPTCPIRVGEPCTLCQYDVHGPEDCPLVYLIMNDPEDREAWAESRPPSDLPPPPNTGAKKPRPRKSAAEPSAAGA